MKKLLSLLLAATMLLSSVPALADTAENANGSAADWTVLIYLCGTDLESGGGMATVNLEEISETLPNGNVNVVIETGGCKEWHAQELGLDIANNRIQRYTWDANGFTLVDEGPMDNMAQAETLTDFIAWGAENYPAEKYALTVWDHGGGSMTGLIVDEMHNSAVMSLEDFGRALHTANVQLEALILDTCLMATLETCAMVDDNVHYLIASEEAVPGQGSDYKTWVQYLYDHPDCDGQALGTVLCDATMAKYVAQEDGTDKTVTFSVTDLTKMEPVYTAFDNLFTELGSMLSDVTTFGDFASAVSRCESFQTNTMRDLGDMVTRGRDNGLSSETADAVINALKDAVVYMVNGENHAYATGLSFYYDPTGNMLYMDRYMRQCFSLPYLAFLDATHMGWTAPESVYEKTSRLPEITYDDYIVQTAISVEEDGIKMVFTNAEDAVTSVSGVLFYVGDDGNTMRMGAINRMVGVTVNEEGKMECIAYIPTTWPTIDGVMCQMNLEEDNECYKLYNVPALLDGSTSVKLRIGYCYNNTLDELAEQIEAEVNADTSLTEDERDTKIAVELLDMLNSDETYAGNYEVYGVWSGATSPVQMPSRDVQPVSELVGHTLTMQMTTYDTSYNMDTGNVSSGSIVVTEEGLNITEEPLPAGDYAYAFSIVDALNSTVQSVVVYFSWDGESIDYTMAYTDADIQTAMMAATLGEDLSALTPVQQMLAQMYMVSVMGVDPSELGLEDVEGIGDLGETEVVTEEPADGAEEASGNAA